MGGSAEVTRWWEHYLVRYLMPSIAGVAIVGWLCSHATDRFRAMLWLPPFHQVLDGTSLTLVFLYGNLFCYVASYPVLVFHVTRVMDFSKGKWPARPFTDGYLATSLFTCLCLALTKVGPTELRLYGSFAIVGVLVVVQIRRLYIVLAPRVKHPGLEGAVSPAYAYSYRLARRRGIPEETENETSSTRRIIWRSELVETYRHMREHGNSAYIFLYELALAALVYCVFAKPFQSEEQQLGAIGALFALGRSLLFSCTYLGSTWRDGSRNLTFRVNFSNSHPLRLCADG